MWSKAWVLPRVSLSGLFIYSPNQSLFWRLYLIRLSLSLGWKNGLDLQPFRSASPGSLSCHLVSVCFPSSRWTLWGKHFFLIWIKYFTCICVYLLVFSVCATYMQMHAEVRRSDPVELVFPGSELPTAGAGNQIWILCRTVFETRSLSPGWPQICRPPCTAFQIPALRTHATAAS